MNRFCRLNIYVVILIKCSTFLEEAYLTALCFKYSGLIGYLSLGKLHGLSGSVFFPWWLINKWKKTKIGSFGLVDLSLMKRWLISLFPLFLPEADTYLTRFTVPQTYNYSVLLVDPASHTLYVGARDTIFALSLPFSGERPRRVRDENGEHPRACD